MKRGILILVTAAMLSPVFTAPKITDAAPWVTVSSWAYNSVSNFKKEGLLPESFNDVDDYTQNITREQLAELVFSVQDRTENLKETKRSYLETRRTYTDTENEAAGYLGKLGIMEGEVVSTDFVDGMMHDNYAFYPDRLLTREEMAAVVYRCMSRSCEYLIKDARDNKDKLKEPTDYKDISKWARDEVLILSDVGVIAGMEDGSFAPKSNLTIEQAMQVLYSYYNLLPTTDEADGANIHSDYEETVQMYANGLTETKQGDVLYLKDGEKVLMSFETDIYSNIYSNTVNGTIYAAAQNVYGKTDVYNAETQELLFKIPRCTEQLTDDFIITKSRSYSAPLFGIYTYDGTELFEPEYSKSELREIAANDMALPGKEYRASDGWIYYTGSEGGIYRIDTNGENKQKLSGNTAFQLTYVDGWLYYLANSQNVTDGIYEPKGYYCTKADGSAEYLISENYVNFLGAGYVEYSIKKDGIGVKEQLVYDFTDTDKLYTNTGGFEHFTPVLHIDGWIYYLDRTDIDEEYNSFYNLCRMKPTDTGINTETVIEGYIIDSVHYKDGKLYFTDRRKSLNAVKSNASDLYCYENGNITLLCDKNVQDFGFYGDNLVVELGDDYDNTTPYLANLDGSNLRVAEDLRAAMEKEEEPVIGMARSSRMRIDVEDDMSDSKYTVFYRRIWNEDNYYDSTLWVETTDGEQYEIGNEENRDLRFRAGDKLYFLENGNSPEKADNRLVSYDLETRREEVVLNGLRRFERGFTCEGDDWFTYLDYRGNILRYNTDDKTIDEVYPCKGLHRYGKMRYLASKNDCMYKVDENGNYLFMTDSCKSNYLFVANGAADGVQYLNYNDYF